MNGQWMGEFKGSYGGLLIVNIDERLNNYEGLAYVLPLDDAIPMSALQFETVNKTPTFKLKTYTPLAIPRTGDFATWETISGMYPGAQMSTSLDLQGTVRDNELALEWKTNIGVEGRCTLPRSKTAMSQPSELVPLQQYWGDFKSYVSSLQGRRELFRVVSVNRGGFGLPIIDGGEATSNALCSTTCLHFIGT